MRVTDTADGTSNTQANGIIAILIGLHVPAQPTPAANEVRASSFQGGCANQGAGAEGAALAFHVLPYLEQESLFKQY